MEHELVVSVDVETVWNRCTAQTTRWEVSLKNDEDLKTTRVLHGRASRSVTWVDVRCRAFGLSPSLVLCHHVVCSVGVQCVKGYFVNSPQTYGSRGNRARPSRIINDAAERLDMVWPS